MPPETPLANASEARTSTGEIKDQTQSTTTTEKTEPTTEQKTEPKAEVKAETKTEDKPSLLNKKDEPSTEVPDKYDFKLPEGFELDETVSKEVTDLFKENKISATSAQSLMDYYIKRTTEANEAPFKLWQETQEKWQNDMRNDAEIGPKLAQVKATVSKAIDSLGDPKLASEFRQAMDYTGAGNNLAFAKVLYRLAQQITEGDHASGGKPSPLGQRRPDAPPTSAAHAMYPTLP